MFNWIRKKGNESADYGKKLVGGEEIKKNFDEVKDMASTVLSPKKQIANAKKETFMEAKNRLNASDTQILRNYRNLSYCFYISLLFAFGCLIGLFYNLFINQAIVSSLAMLSIFLFCMANCFKFSFRAFQIKHQKLCSVQEWWDRANEWLPEFPKNI